MKRLVLIIMSAMAGLLAHAQVAPISGQVISQYGQPVPFAQVRICSVTSSGTPCTPSTPIFQDYSLTIPSPNPLTADQFGNFNVYVPALANPNLYLVQVTPQAGTTYDYVYAGPASGGGGSGTVVEINGTPILPSSPANFVNTATVNWQFVGGQIQATATAASALTLQHNGANLTDQALLNFNDVTPTPPTGNVNITYQPDSLGDLSAYVPTAPSQLQLQYTLQGSGQHVILYPTTGGSFGTPGTSTYGATQAGTGTIVMGGYTLPSYINPANVTAVYLGVYSSAYIPSGLNTEFAIVNNGGGTSNCFNSKATGLLPPNTTPNDNWPPGWSQAPCEIVAPTNVGAITFNFTLAAAPSPSSMSVYSAPLEVYYTGTPPPTPPAAVYVAPPLNWNGLNDTLSLSSPFNLGVDFGATNNTYLVDSPLLVAGPQGGDQLILFPAHVNTGASTIKVVDGADTAAHRILTADGINDLSGAPGFLQVNGPQPILFDGANWRLVGGVPWVNNNPGGLQLNFSSGAGSCSYSGGTTTCTVTGSGSGGGSVTNFIANSGSWPPFLVPSVATSTTTPTLSVSLASQTANTVLAGPSSGSASAPAFRALVPADLPLGSSSSAGALECGSGTSCSGGVLTVAGAISLTSASSTLVLSPSPITGTGTLDLNLAHSNIWSTQQTMGAGIAWTEIAAPSGSTGSDIMWGDSLRHSVGVNLNNGGTAYIATANGLAPPGDCVQFGSDGIRLADAGAPCGSGGGGGGVSGQAVGVIGLATSATTTGAQSHINETAPGLTAVTQAVSVNDGTGNAGTVGLRSGTLGAGSTGYAILTSNTQGQGILNENNTGSGRICSTFNAQCVTVGGTPTSTNYALFSAGTVIGDGHFTDNGSVNTSTEPLIVSGAVTASALIQPSASTYGGTCTMSSSTTCGTPITIAHTFTTPVCIATEQGAGAIAGSCSVSGTTVTITAASSNSGTWGAFVFGNPN